MQLAYAIRASNNELVSWCQLELPHYWLSNHAHLACKLVTKGACHGQARVGLVFEPEVQDEGQGDTSTCTLTVREVQQQQ